MARIGSSAGPDFKGSWSMLTTPVLPEQLQALMDALAAYCFANGDYRPKNEVMIQSAVPT